jgi:GAF domain-containing protein
VTEPIHAEREPLSVTIVTILHPRDHPRDARLDDPSRESDRYDEHFLRCAALVLAAESLSESVLREFAIRLPLFYLADWCVLHLVTTTPGGFVVPVVVGAHIDHDQERLAQTIWRQAVETTPHAIPPLTSMLRAHETSPPAAHLNIGLTWMTSDSVDSPAADLLARCDLATAVHVPLVAGARTYGVLTFTSKAPERYGPRQVALAIAYASWVAGVLDRAQSRRPAPESMFASVPARDIASA